MTVKQKINSKTIILAILIAQCTIAFSQEEDIMRIREEYESAKKLIQQHEAFNIKSHLELSDLVPSLGNVYTSIKFYGDNALQEEGIYGVSNSPKESTLRFIELHLSCDCSTRNKRIEYLYHTENQDVIFIYIKDLYENTEERYYFNQNKVIRYSQKYISPSSGNLETITLNANQLSTNEISAANRIQTSATKYLTIYKNIHELRKIEN
jgi:hypothetical protein